MQPALQLLGAKGFALPLRYQVGKRGGVQAQQINGFVGVHVVGAMNVAGWQWLSGCKCYLRGRRKRFPQQRFQRSEEQKSELQSLIRISYAVFCLKKKQI